MPILIDLSHVAVSNIMVTPGLKKGDVDTLLVKHMILSSLKKYKRLFGKEYGELVICCDARGDYWRHGIFPHYKANRKSKNKKSLFDWNEVFGAISEMKEDLTNYFPYKVVEVPEAEADDVIAIIAKNELKPTLIVGADKDYCQLLQHKNVRQYSPAKKKMVVCIDPAQQLKELIITGDGGDGIPNIKSDSDTFVVQTKRQSPIKKTEIALWSKLETPEMFCESKRMLENYRRNEELISFEKIPSSLQGKILKAYTEAEQSDKGSVYNYLVKNRMSLLLKDVGDF